MDKNGALQASAYAKNNLHSRYNPQSEAERYIDSLNLKTNIKYFILIEPGRGFLIPVLQEKFKESKIIVLHIEKQDDLPDIDSDIPVFTGTEPAQVQGFLESNIKDNIENVKIIEWRPSLNHYKELYVKLLSAVVSFLKRTDAGNRTTALFGKRWVRNFFRNLDTLNKNLLYKQTETPVIITGSGPGLEEALPLIKDAQNTHLIIAASSSVMALSHSGISADLIISADGGSWALKHLYPCYRESLFNKKSGGVKALAVNLCAALPSQCEDTPLFLINDGTFWQSVILHELSLPSVIITQKGTVTAAAIELALILSSSNIYLAGMDLSVNDIRTHAKPYSFDNLFLSCANRFNPFYSQCFMRSYYTSKGESLDIYASWFKTQLNTWEKRIFSVTDSRIFKTAKPDKNLKNKNIDDFFKETKMQNNSESLRERGAAALLKALKNKEYAQNIKQELVSLLFAGEDSVTDEELEKTIKKTALHGTCHE